MSSRFRPLLALAPAAIAAAAFAADHATLDNIVVTATRQPMRTAEILTDVSTIERSDIDGAGHSSLEEILASQPGVEMTSNGSQGAASSLMIRGTNGSHVLLLVDGVRIGSATSGNIAWSRIPANQIERIEIIRGPASSLYGSEAIGGVIQIFTRQGHGPLRFTAEAGAGSYGTRSTNAGFSGSHDGWRYALNLSQYTTDGFDSKPEDSKANHDKDGFRNDSASGRLAHEFARGHELAFGFLYSEGKNQYDSSGIAVDWVNRTRNGAANLTLKNALTGHWNSTLSVGQSIDKSKALKDDVRNSVFDTEQRQYAWQNDIRSSFGNFLLGFERLEQEVDTTSRYARFERSNNSLLAGWNHGFASHRLQASVRHDDNSQFGNKTTGTAAYGYRFTPNWRANVSVGTAFKAPTFNDLYYPLTGKYVGNPALKPESARNQEASLHYETGSQHVSLTWYLNRVEDLIIWPKAGAVIMPTNVSNARIEGSTLAWQGNVGKFNLAASYDWVDAKDGSTGKQLPRRARHSAKASVGQTIGDWEWRAELFANGQRYDDEANTVRMGGYTLAHVYAAYRFAKDWSVFTRINNVFDRDYTLTDGYATPGRNAFVGIRYSPQ